MTLEMKGWFSFMVYYEDEKLIIRNMENADAQIFTDEFTAQGWHPEIDGYSVQR
jgi:hypothetical protein